VVNGVEAALMADDLDVQEHEMLGVVRDCLEVYRSVCDETRLLHPGQEGIDILRGRVYDVVDLLSRCGESRLRGNVV
jgi:hypothetical protein